MESTIVPVYKSDFSKVCRICLSTEQLQPISNIEYKQTPIVSFLNSCTSMQIQKDDDLPQNLCSVCFEEIIKIHNFQEKCKQTDTLLRAALPDIEIVKHEVEDKDIVIKEETVFDCDDEIPEEFFCGVCLKEFATDQKLNEHLENVKHSKLVRNHPCSICSKLFVSNHDLLRHMRTHTREKPYKCALCLQTFTLSGNLNRHMMTHTKERPHQCHKCQKGFTRAYLLAEHLFKKHSPKTDQLPPGTISHLKFDCSVCLRSFKRLGLYKLHLRTHDMVELEINEQKLIEEEVRGHVCMMCEKSFTTKSLLKKHIQMHDEKTFICTDCGKGFVTITLLEKHVKLHTEGKPYTKLSPNNSLRKHNLLQNKQLKPYGLEKKIKNGNTNESCDLRRHSQKKPYVCNVCHKQFTSESSLVFHIRGQTGKKPYNCKVYGKTNRDSSGFETNK